MGWKRQMAVWTINGVALALLTGIAAADRIERFTDSRGIICITNLNGANGELKTPGVQTNPPRPEAVPPSQATNPQKPRQRDKRYKMRRLAIEGDAEYNTEKVLQEERKPDLRPF
jgi:hypothetical protein